MQIHETAFIVSTYRSLHEEISKDNYAKLWNNPNTDALIPSILDTISKDEAIMHSLRNRFFYERMKSFFEKNSGGTLINFGSGFSMYQFSFSTTVSTIEIDKKDIIDYKKMKVDNWTKEGKLPDRDIQYVAVDFNHNTADHIIKTLKPLIKEGPIFILIEGVFFFLNEPTTTKLFRIFKGLQNPGDLVGSVTYLPEVENTEVYKRLLHYFDSNNDTNDSFSHQTIPHSYYKNIDGYILKEHTDEFDLLKIYAPRHSITDKKDILNENMYLLERT